MDTTNTPLPTHGKVSSQIRLNQDGTRTLHVLSTGTTEFWARWSTWPVGNMKNASWTHTDISIPSSSRPSHLSSDLIPPILCNESFSRYSPENLGFCAVGAPDGEIYHTYKRLDGKWKCDKITNIRRSPESKELSIHFAFYTHGDKYHLLVLLGAQWMDYSWSPESNEILSLDIHFSGGNDQSLRHVTCRGKLCPLYLNNIVYFFFRGTNGLIYECQRDEPDWKLNDLSAASTETSMTRTRPAGSDLSVISQGDVIHLFFVGADRRLRELYKVPGKNWRHVSLRRLVGSSVCSLPEQSQPYTCVIDGCLHVFFKNSDAHVGECFWKKRKSRWRVIDTSELIPRHGRILSLLDIASDEGPHLFFVTEEKSKSLFYYHLHWTDGRWISAIWGNREYDANPKSLRIAESLGFESLDEFSEAYFSFEESNEPVNNPVMTLQAAASSNGGIPAPPPPPPKNTAPTAHLTVKRITTPFKPPLVVRVPMKPGSYQSKLDKYQKIRLVIVSDTHNYHERVGELPDGDILVHCGDFTVYGKSHEIKSFAEWLDSQTKFNHKIVIAGNHEVHPRKAKTILDKHCIWLDDKMVTVLGINFYGTSWRADYLKLPHKGVDVLLTHAPPEGHGDVIYTGVSRDNPDLTAAVATMKPIIYAFGHNHEGFGATCNTNTIFINAATCMGSAKSSGRRSSVVVDLYPELKSKYGSQSVVDMKDFTI